MILRTLDHPKFKYFVKKSGHKQYEAVGILESIWMFTKKHAQQGNIGKWTNEEIADAIDYPPEKIDELIQLLIRCRFLDECPEHRLLVHDWAGNCEGWLKAQLSKKKLPILTSTLIESTRKKPNHTKPYQAKPSHTNPSEFHKSNTTEAKNAKTLADLHFDILRELEIPLTEDDRTEMGRDYRDILDLEELEFDLARKILEFVRNDNSKDGKFFRSLITTPGLMVKHSRRLIVAMNGQESAGKHFGRPKGLQLPTGYDLPEGWNGDPSERQSEVEE